ncbi:putative hydrolase YdeN [compost metagenome]
MQDHIQIGENDIVIGWSSGAVAAMRYAESHTVRGLVLVSPSYTDLGDELEKQSGYFDTPWKWDKIKENSQSIALITGDDDPYIPQDEFNTLAKELDATRIIVPNGEHFIERSEFSELLDYIRSTYIKG